MNQVKCAVFFCVKPERPTMLECFVADEFVASNHAARSTVMQKQAVKRIKTESRFPFFFS